MEGGIWDRERGAAAWRWGFDRGGGGTRAPLPQDAGSPEGLRSPRQAAEKRYSGGEVGGSASGTQRRDTRTGWYHENGKRMKIFSSNR